jgi:hypothetical protein
MATTNTATKWAGIESEALDSNTWIQMGYRHSASGTREYRVFGEIHGKSFSESYHSDSDDNKRLAYDYYWEQLDKF